MSDLITQNPIRCAVFAWIAVISIIGIIVCIYDKIISKKNDVKLRIPEKRLFVAFPLLGGGAAMFLTMQLIRHKTKHWQTYVLIPLFTAVWVVGIVLLFRFDIH